MHVSRHLRHYLPPIASSALALMGGPAGAQQAQLALAGGTGTDARGVTSSAVTLAPSVTIAGTHASAVLGAAATQFANDAWALGGSGSVQGDAPLHRHLALSLAASGGITRTSFAASFAAAEATPAVELRLAPLTLFAGARAARGLRSVEQSTAAFPALPGEERVARERVVRGSLGPVFGGVLRFTPSAQGGDARLSYREERAVVDRVAVADRVVGATLTYRALTVGGTAGLRNAADERRSFGGVDAGVAVTPALLLQVGGGSYPSNRLTGALGGRYLTAGLVLRTGRSAVRAPAPTVSPEDVAAPPRGWTRLALRARDARRVEVAGDWSGWQPAEASRARNGVWYVDLDLRPGRYRYAFRVDGNAWTVPDGATAVDDGLGGTSAWLTVP